MLDVLHLLPWPFSLCLGSPNYNSGAQGNENHEQNPKKSLKNALEQGFWLFLRTVAGSESIVGSVEPKNKIHVPSK